MPERRHLTRAAVVRLCHQLDDQSREADGRPEESFEAFVWATFTDRRSEMLDLSRFVGRQPDDVCVVVAAGGLMTPVRGVNALSAQPSDPLVQAWEFGVAVPGFSAFLRASAAGPPPTSSDSADRVVDVDLHSPREAAAALRTRLEAVAARLPSDVVRRAHRHIEAVNA